MVENGYVTREDGDEGQGRAARRQRRAARGSYLFAAEYFAEEVRRKLIERYGENELYEGGLSVRTTLDPKLQVDGPQGAAERPDQVRQARGFRGPVDDDRHRAAIGASRSARCKRLADVPEWRLAVVLERSEDGADDRLAAEARGVRQGRAPSARPARSPPKT